jgi:hypothetical protein
MKEGRRNFSMPKHRGSQRNQLYKKPTVKCYMFRQLSAEMDSEYLAIIFRNESLWLSGGLQLRRFFGSRHEVCLFLKNITTQLLTLRIMPVFVGLDI